MARVEFQLPQEQLELWKAAAGHYRLSQWIRERCTYALGLPENTRTMISKSTEPQEQENKEAK